MVQEILDLLAVHERSPSLWIDGTLGLGGHARSILMKSLPEGRLLGIDRDPQALAMAKERLAEFGDRVVLRQATFDQAPRLLKELGWGEADGMLLDLGVSSYQLESADRGFSFSRNGPLDMRMNPEDETSAQEFLAEASEAELKKIFEEWGEERHARKIAQHIVSSRKKKSITTTAELRALIHQVVWPSRGQRIDPATRVFQALRIAVNEELKILKNFLNEAPNFLRVGGVLAVLSYHSLEDRIVKQAFRSYENFQILTKKPQTASDEELRSNPRARSAKLRAVRRLE